MARDREEFVIMTANLNWDDTQEEEYGMDSSGSG